MVAGGEAGKGCTGTWGRFHCRNGWEVEMVAGGDAGNGYTVVHVPVEGFTAVMTGRSISCQFGGRRVARGWLYSYLDRQEVLIGQGRRGFQRGTGSVQGEEIASEIFSPESNQIHFWTQ